MFTQRSTRGARLLVTAVLPVAALATVAACGNEKAPGPGKDPGSVRAPDPVQVGGTPVAGVHWTVRSMTVDGTTTKAPSGAYVEFVSAARVRGSYGCNHFDARAHVADDTVDLGKSAVTDMYCADRKQRAFEKSLARALAAENTVKARGNDRLTLTGPDGDTVTLVKQRDAKLLGTKWNVTGLSADETTRSLPKPAQGRARLVFREDGRVDVRLGCNSGGAKATVKNGHITFGPLTSTKMGCVGAAAEVEKAMRNVLDGRASYDIQGDGMTLEAPDGTGLSMAADR
ncbi:META domain-containing protein [Streptomyces sp. SID8379]|uniref:META domain-containing protein n=1 Tax=unclassified Streptomyces TaxID=2593676 RepID=UPI0003614872|nr:MULTISPECIES: META domain-containing protein [unclassified Streptomyces]MYW63818.1 META domain-containing protein [Streptomyces sp. SID8379]